MTIFGTMSDQHWGNYEIIKQDHDTITTMGISHVSSHLCTQRGNNSKSGRKRNLIRADWKARHMVHRNFCFQLKHPPPPRQTKYKLKQTIVTCICKTKTSMTENLCGSCTVYHVQLQSKFCKKHYFVTILHKHLFLPIIAACNYLFSPHYWNPFHPHT